MYVLDRAAARAVDRAASEEFGIPGIVLMENAALAIAGETLAMITGRADPVVMIVCGSGNNGGDGWALARHLHNAGVRAVVVPLGEPRPTTDAGLNCAIARRMRVEEITPDDIEGCPAPDLIVDAIFGTGLDREVRGVAVGMIEWINAASALVLAVDVPSGLDCDTGKPFGAAVRATRTVSFVGMKPGFDQAHAQPYLGEIVIGDIGAPRELTERFGRPARGHGRHADDRRGVVDDER